MLGVQIIHRIYNSHYRVFYLSMTETSNVPQENDGELTFDWESIKKRVFNPKSMEDLISAYDDWSTSYDNHLDELEYTAPTIASLELQKCIGTEKKDNLILDAGAGTGRVGVVLSKNLGFKNIDALDASKKMLEVADGIGVYRKTILAFLGKPNILPIEDSTYDHLICVGTFTISHVKADALEEMIRIVKVGGCMVFTMRGVYENFKSSLDELYENKVLEKISQKTIFGQTKERCEMVLLSARVLKHM